MLIKDIDVSDKTKQYFESRNCKTVEESRIKLTLLDIDEASKDGYDLEELVKVIFYGIEVNH